MNSFDPVCTIPTYVLLWHSSCTNSQLKNVHFSQLEYNTYVHVEYVVCKKQGNFRIFRDYLLSLENFQFGGPILISLIPILFHVSKIYSPNSFKVLYYLQFAIQNYNTPSNTFSITVKKQTRKDKMKTVYLFPLINIPNCFFKKKYKMQMIMKVLLKNAFI